MKPMLWGNRLAGGFEQESNPLDLLTLLTVVLLLLSPVHVWYLQTPLVMLCILGIAYRPLLRKTPFWYVITTLWGTTIYFNWASADNHKYLIGYWCLALCCAFTFSKSHQASALAITSRLLIGLCMAFATLWKLHSDTFLDGSFFEFVLLTDSRFQHVTRLVSDLGASSLADNRELQDLLRYGYLRGIELESVQLAGKSQVAMGAAIFTWWTLLFEAALAVLFLIPDTARTSRIRNLALLLFGATTYAVAPVKGFGWVLMLLGMAQCGPHQRGFRLAYLAVFLLVQAYTAPLAELFEVVRN